MAGIKVAEKERRSAEKILFQFEGITKAVGSGDDASIKTPESPPLVDPFLAELDYDLQALKSRMIENHAANRQFCYDNDNTVQKTLLTIGRTIAGNEIRFESNHKKAEDLLNKFSKKLRGNTEAYDVTRLIQDLYVESGIHAEGIFKKIKLEVSKTIEVWPIDYRELSPIVHKDNGWKKWIQTARIPEDQPNKLSAFNSISFNPTHFTILFKGTTNVWQQKRRNIIMEDVICFKGFNVAPIGSVMHLVKLKRQLQYYLFVIAKRSAIPIRGLKLEKDITYGDEAQTQKMMQHLGIALASAEEGSPLIIPGIADTIRIDESSPIDIISYLGYIDKQIVLALGGSMSLFEASGTELATSRTIQNTFVRTVKANRLQIETLLKQSLFDPYLELNGINPEKISYSMTWTPLPDDTTPELINSVIQMYEAGLIGLKEARQLLAGEMSLRELPKKEMDELIDKAEEKDDQFGGGQFGQEPEAEQSSDEDKKKETEEPPKVEEQELDLITMSCFLPDKIRSKTLQAIASLENKDIVVEEREEAVLQVLESAMNSSITISNLSKQLLDFVKPSLEILEMETVDDAVREYDTLKGMIDVLKKDEDTSNTEQSSDTDDTD